MVAEPVGAYRSPVPPVTRRRQNRRQPPQPWWADLDQDELLDVRGRPYIGGEALIFTVSADVAAAVVYDRSFTPDYENFVAASDTLGGRFPGGQNSLFHGLWTDPVTGLSFARARWYDARNATWLSEDPLSDIDSPNLYAFVSWRPNSARDTSGLELGDWWDPRSYADLELFTDEARERSNKFLKGEVTGAWNAAKATARSLVSELAAGFT